MSSSQGPDRQDPADMSVAGSGADVRAFREAMIAATQARKNMLKKYDNDIMCMIHRLGGVQTFQDVHRAALAAENTLRRHRNVEAALAALIADPSPLKIRLNAVKRSWAEYLRDRISPEGMRERAAARFFADPERVVQLRSLLMACQSRMRAEAENGLRVDTKAA